MNRAEEQAKNRAAQLQAARSRRTTSMDYRKVFQSPEGERVLRDLMKQFHAMGTTYFQGDTHQTAFREGQRNVFLHIVNELNYDYEALEMRLQQMIKESRHV